MIRQTSDPNTFLETATFIERLSTVLILMGMLLASASAYGARGDESDADEVTYAWPAPPAEAVVQFERILKSKSDVGGKSSWKDRLLGKKDDPFSDLRRPYGVFSDGKGRVYVADSQMPGLVIFDFNEKEYRLIGAEGANALTKIFGVAVSRHGRIYVTDGLAKAVFIFEADGTFASKFGPEGEFGRPVGIAIDQKKDLVYVSDTLKHNVTVFDLQGQQLDVIGESGIAENELFFPLGLAVDRDGMLYVVDSMNFRVQIIDPVNHVFQQIGKQGDGPGTFQRPRGVAVDRDGNIWVTDAAFNKVQIFDREGQLLMFFGTPDRNPGGFQLPSGIYIDQNDHVFIADQGNRRIQEFTFLGAPENLPEPAQN